MSSSTNSITHFINRLVGCTRESQSDLIINVVKQTSLVHRSDVRFTCVLGTVHSCKTAGIKDNLGHRQKT